MSNCPVRAHQKIRKQIELPRREPRCTAAHAHLSRRKINFHALQRELSQPRVIRRLR